MAQQTVVTLIDDITGQVAQETVRFGLDGIEYEIDLEVGNAGKLRAALAAYVDAGRRTSARKTQAVAARREDLALIRRWGRDQGYPVSDRGRVAESVKTAYREAHSGRPSVAA